MSLQTGRHGLCKYTCSTSTRIARPSTAVQLNATSIQKTFRRQCGVPVFINNSRIRQQWHKALRDVRKLLSFVPGPRR